MGKRARTAAVGAIVETAAFAAQHFEAQAAKDAVCFLSGALRGYAVAFTKIANDLRWLGSGPRCGLGELRIPETQPGSSIMPGKVNPVIAESALMACAEVIGHDATIAWCAAAGVFELNVMMPVIAQDLLDSIRLLAASSRNFADKVLALGLYVSVSGIVTFKNAKELQETAKAIPAARLLIETDSPFLAPVPHRGRPCEPAFVADTAKFLADLRGEPLETLAATTTANFKRLFRKASA